MGKDCIGKSAAKVMAHHAGIGKANTMRPLVTISRVLSIVDGEKMGCGVIG